MREWEFVIINDKKERLRVLNLKDMTSYDECEKMMDSFNMTARNVSYCNAETVLHAL